MRICVIFSKGTSSDKDLKIVSAFIKGLEAANNSVDFFDISKEKEKLTSFYDYVAVGSSNIPLFGKKDDPLLEQFLKQNNIVAGRRSFAFTTKRVFGENKTLQSIMKIMEKEGMLITFSEVLKDEISAKEIGKNLVISKTE
ncbi:MAG: hypothetical protein WCY53_01770 [Sphaerochaetaceae bacterium]|jgi:hypothetical protein